MDILKQIETAGKEILGNYDLKVTLPKYEKTKDFDITVKSKRDNYYIYIIIGLLILFMVVK